MITGIKGSQELQEKQRTSQVHNQPVLSHLPLIHNLIFTHAHSRDWLTKQMRMITAYCLDFKMHTSASKIEHSMWGVQDQCFLCDPQRTESMVSQTEVHKEGEA
jgi:phosphohistidine phosphatase SixA